MTPLRPTDLREPARNVAAGIALRHLAAAIAAARRLRPNGEAEALHDVRVALRRLRTILRAYAPQLKRPAAKKVRRRLRALGRASAAARDAQVQLDWLAGRRFAGGPADAAGAWLASRLRADHGAAARSIRAEFRPELRRLAATLRPALARAQRRGDGLAYGEATARLLLEHAATLAARLRAVEGAGDRTALHRARIAGKRLRYLLEPLVGIDPAAGELVAALKAFQDRLGEIVDAHVRTDVLADAARDAGAQWAPAAVRSLVATGSDRVADPDVLVGLFALAAATRAEIDAGYAVVRECYATPAWLAPLRDLATRLREVRPARREVGGLAERRRRAS